MWKNANADYHLLSQVLFGESVRIINVKNKKWVRVACMWDGQLGWMHPSHLYIIDEAAFRKIKNHRNYNLELIYGIISNNMSIPITIGADLHHFDGINVRMPFGKFQFSGQVFSAESTDINENLLIKISNKFLHAPEMNGGRSILGVDNAAFIQLLFKFVGISLPRKAMDQAQKGEDIGFVNFAQIGDLAFFTKGNNEQICHVGMLTGEQSIIHVHGKVKIDQLDQQGIFDLETRRYTYKLRTIRRLINF